MGVGYSSAHLQATHINTVYSILTELERKPIGTHTNVCTGLYLPGLPFVIPVIRQNALIRRICLPERSKTTCVTRELKVVKRRTVLRDPLKGHPSYHRRF